MADIRKGILVLLLGLGAAVVAAAPAPASAQARVPPPAPSAQPISRWLVRIPVPADTGRAGLLKDYLRPGAAEADILPEPGDPERGPWIEARTDSTGAVDFNRLFEGSTEHTVAYAHAYLSAPEERGLRLLISSDDGVEAILNGQVVWAHDVGRGLATGTDTVDVRLAAGWNTLLLKVRNRTGDFGLRVLLAAVPEGPGLGGLRTSVGRPAGLAAPLHPAPAVAVGPVHLTGPLAWRGDGLVAPVRLPVTAWGPDTLRAVRVAVRQGGTALAADSFPLLVPGRPDSLDVRIPFARLRRSALGRDRIRGRSEWRGGSDEEDVGVGAGTLLRLAGGRLDLGFGPIDVHGQRVDRFATRLVVPAALAGDTIEILARGLGPKASYTVNGEARTWSAGTVSLCSPCREGDTLDVALVPDPGRPVWLAPEARAAGPGFAEYADGWTYARRLLGEPPAIGPPDPREWLRALGSSRGYDQLLQRYADAYAPAARRIRADTLLLVGNSHIDAAWLWPWSETQDVIRNTWRTSLKLASIFPGYVFAASAAAYYAAVDRLEPALGDSLRQAVKDGSWAVVGGWWLEPDVNLPSGESLVRQGLYGQRWFERNYGERATVAWLPDSFGYPWTLPEILDQQGFRAFVTQKLMWASDSTKFPYDAFWWEAPDGSRLFTYFPHGYDSHLRPDPLIEDRLDDRRKQGLHDQVVLYGVGDHGGGPTIDMLERARDLARVPTFPVMEYAAPGEALDRVRAERPDSAFPTWDDELYLEYHRGTYTTQAWMKRRNRRSEARLQTAEALAALDTAAYPREALRGAWLRVLFNQFHDLLPGSGIHEIYLHAMARYDSAWATLDSLDARSMAGLAARMDTRGRGRAVVVFNPLGWTRGGRAAVPPASGGGGRAAAATAGSARIGTGGGAGDTIWITVDSVPALGARVVHVPADTMAPTGRAAPAPSAGPGWIANGRLRVQVDTADGEITSIRELPSGREVLAPRGRGNVLELFDDQPEQWDAWNLVDWRRNWAVTKVTALSTRANAERAEIRMTRTWGTSTFTQTLALERGAPALEVNSDIDWHETHKLLKVGFTLAVDADSATYEIPYGTIGRSGSPRTKAERAKFEVPGQRWADVSGAGWGVSLLTRDKYGWDYHGHTLRLSLLRSPTWPDSLADRGRQRTSFELLPHDGDWRDAEIERRAAAYNVPLVAAAEPSHGGPLGRAWSFASAEPGNVHIAWLKRAEDSDAYVLRLVEWHGEPADARVTLACPIRSASRTNLLEDPGAPVAVSGRTATLRLRPHEIATLMVECGE